MWASGLLGAEAGNAHLCFRMLVELTLWFLDYSNGAEAENGPKPEDNVFPEGLSSVQTPNPSHIAVRPEEGGKHSLQHSFLIARQGQSPIPQPAQSNFPPVAEGKFHYRVM